MNVRDSHRVDCSVPCSKADCLKDTDVKVEPQEVPVSDVCPTDAEIKTEPQEVTESDVCPTDTEYNIKLEPVVTGMGESFYPTDIELEVGVDIVAETKDSEMQANTSSPLPTTSSDNVPTDAGNKLCSEELGMSQWRWFSKMNELLGNQPTALSMCSGGVESHLDPSASTSSNMETGEEMGATAAKWQSELTKPVQPAEDQPEADQPAADQPAATDQPAADQPAAPAEPAEEVGQRGKVINPFRCRMAANILPPPPAAMSTFQTAMLEVMQQNNNAMEHHSNAFLQEIRAIRSQNERFVEQFTTLSYTLLQQAPQHQPPPQHTSCYHPPCPHLQPQRLPQRPFSPPHTPTPPLRTHTLPLQTYTPSPTSTHMPSPQPPHSAVFEGLAAVYDDGSLD